MKYYATILLLVFVSEIALSQATWDQVGPYGGYIRSLAKDAGGNVYAGTFLGGIFKTSNNGTSWAQLYHDTLKADFRSVAVNSSGHIFGGTAGFGVQRSTNGGTTWQRLSGFLFTSTVSALLILPNDDIIAGSFDGVFRSTNNGTSFSFISTGLTNTTIYAVAANGSGHLFAATAGDGVFRSTNAGANWVPINTGIDANDLIIFGLGVKSGTEIYAASGRKLYRSTNNGDSWTPQLPVASASYSSVAFAPNGDIYAAATSLGGIFKSTNSGSTWTQEAGLPSVPHYALVTSGSMIFAGTEGPGVYTSSTSLSPHNTWTLSVNGMTNTHVYVLEEGMDGSLYAGTRFAGLFKSTDSGLTWINSSTGLPHDWINAIAVNPVNGYLFAANNSAKFRSTDNGATWQQIHPAGATAMRCNAQGHVFAGLGSQVARSTNNGTSWTFSNLFSVTNIADIAFDADTVYLATGNINGTTGQGVYRSTNNGTSWGAFNDGLTDLNVTTIAVDPLPSAGYDNPLICPRVNCGTKGHGVQSNVDLIWHPAGLDGKAVRKLRQTGKVSNYAAFVIAGLVLFARDETCVFDIISDFTIDENEPLDLLFIPLPNNQSLSGSAILIGTNGGGIYRGVNVINSVKPQTALPTQFSLSQNYPNPFNPGTRIVYTVKSRELVSLKVFDMLGREVTTLVDETKLPGEYSVTFDGSQFSSGVYFYRLATSDFVLTKKLILLK